MNEALASLEGSELLSHLLQPGLPLSLFCHHKEVGAGVVHQVFLRPGPAEPFHQLIAFKGDLFVHGEDRVLSLGEDEPAAESAENRRHDQHAQKDLGSMSHLCIVAQKRSANWRQNRRMARILVPEAEALIDQEIPLLDKGFIRLVDYMGGDQRIVQAARVSYGGGTKSFRQDRALIHYLLRHEHTSPFEQVVLTFHCKMPIFVARQWVRHRTARLNEISGRYSIMKDDFYVPEASQMRNQSTDNKQARGDELIPESDQMIAELKADQAQLYQHYLGMIDKGLAREVARTNLPLSLYTEWYWQMDLHNLFHFIRLRSDPHAQYEIRVYAEAIAQCAKAVAPLAYEAFEEHIQGSIRFSRAELAAITRMLEGKEPTIEGRNKEIFDSKLAKMRAAHPAEDTEELAPPTA